MQLPAKICTSSKVRNLVGPYSASKHSIFDVIRQASVMLTLQVSSYCCLSLHVHVRGGEWSVRMNSVCTPIFAGELVCPLEMKWNESGFMPPLCTYRLNWARRNSWGWWDDWDDTVLQTQNSKFEPWRSEAEHATSRSRRLRTILTFTRGWGRNIFVSFKPPRPGTEPQTLAWKAAVLTTTLEPPPFCPLGLFLWIEHNPMLD